MIVSLNVRAEHRSALSDDCRMMIVDVRSRQPTWKRLFTSTITNRHSSNINQGDLRCCLLSQHFESRTDVVITENDHQMRKTHGPCPLSN